MHIRATGAFAALFSLMPMIASAANAVIKIATTETANIYRTDINSRTFGSGLQFNSSQLRWTMDHLDDPNDSSPPVSAITSDTIRWLNLGTLRFPNGDSSFLYISEDPQASYPNISPVTQWNRYLTPDEIVRYTNSPRLNMERLFEVNTVFWLDKSTNNWAYRYINKNQFPTGSAPELDLANLEVAAQRAADWVRRDNENGKTALWEVGNEDWARWNAKQHAQIFDVFQQKMKAVRPDIKLLAQGLATPFNANSPHEWFYALRDRLQAKGQLDRVYAYSVHQYMKGGVYPGEDRLTQRRKQTEDMLAAVAEGAPVQTVRKLLGTGNNGSPTGNWKIWMTEFNVHQPTGRKNEKNEEIFDTLQDMGHALVIADWTGKMLEQNVERMFMHSLDNHPSFSLVQYDNGTDIEHPRVTVPGYAYAKYAQGFGKTMVRNTIQGNTALTAPNGKKYPQVAVYSSVSADNMSLRVMVINRHMTNPVNVDLDTENVQWRRRLANGQFALQQLRSNKITDGNQQIKGNVKWSDPAYYPQGATGIQNITLAPASANFFVIPLQP